MSFPSRVESSSYSVLNDDDAADAAQAADAAYDAYMTAYYKAQSSDN